MQNLQETTSVPRLYHSTTRVAWVLPVGVGYCSLSVDCLKPPRTLSSWSYCIYWYEFLFVFYQVIDIRCASFPVFLSFQTLSSSATKRLMCCFFLMVFFFVSDFLCFCLVVFWRFPMCPANKLAPTNATTLHIPWLKKESTKASKKEGMKRKKERKKASDLIAPYAVRLDWL